MGREHASGVDVIGPEIRPLPARSAGSGDSLNDTRSVELPTGGAYHTVGKYRGRGTTEKVTIAFFRQLGDRTAFGAATVSVRARVFLAWKGAAQQFEFDVGTGCILSVPAEQIDVEMANNGTAAIRAGVVFGRGDRSQGRPATLVDQGGPIIVGGTATVQVPPLCRALAFQRQPIATTACRLDMTFDAVQANRTAEITLGMNQSLGFDDAYPITSDIRSVVVQNINPNPQIDHYRAIWILDL